MTFTPISRHSNPAAYSGERALNYIVETADTTSPMVARGRSGLSMAYALGAVRAMASTEAGLWAAAGGRLWLIDAAGATPKASIPEDENTSIAAGRIGIGIVTNGSYYFWHIEDETLEIVPTGAVSTPRGVVHQNGYMCVYGGGEGREDAIAFSDLNDPRTFDVLKVVFAEIKSDRITRMVSVFGRLWAFGPASVQTFSLLSSPGTGSPFAPDTLSVIERGALNGRTVAVDESAAYWLGADGRAYAAASVEPMRISNAHVEAALTSVTDGFIYSDRGHRFYVLRQSAGPAWAYDITEGRWFEFSSGTGEGPWIATGAAEWNGQVWAATGTGLANPGGYDDDGEIVRAELVTPPIEQGGVAFSVSRLRLQCETGAPDIGRTPQVSLQASTDGRVWGAPRWRSLGDQGDYGREVQWARLGRAARMMQLRITITDPVPRDLHGVEYEI